MAGRPAEWEGEAVTEVRREWRSDLLIATEEWLATGGLDGWDASAWQLDGSSGERMATAPVQRSLATLGAWQSSAAGEPTWGPLCEAPPTYVAANKTLFRKVGSRAVDSRSHESLVD